MSDYGGELVGEIEITDLYEDNEIFLREVRFSIPFEKWSEFEKLQGYREIAAFVEGLRTQYNTAQPPELRWPEETEENSERKAEDAECVSVWDRVRKVFRNRQCR